jgi:apolipoprotein N-acyltransferase
MVLIIAVFVSRILGWFEIGRWVGFASSLIIVPLVYLFVVGLGTGRRRIYFVWLALMVLFALFELVVDQILRIDLRSAQWTVVPYVMFFFAATGGMIGVASQAGKSWAITTVIVFFIMAILAFIQRGITGL